MALMTGKSWYSSLPISQFDLVISTPESIPLAINNSLNGADLPLSFRQTISGQLFIEAPLTSSFFNSKIIFTPLK